MDYRAILSQHLASNADVTVATIPVTRKDVSGFGIMRMDPDFRISEFVEKPNDPAIQNAFQLAPEWYQKLDIASNEELFLASMGIYVFNRKALFELLDESHHDFGKDIIPRALRTHRVCGYVFQGVWEDIGTIRSYFDCSLDLTAPLPRFNLFDMTAPVFTRPRFLPSSKINSGTIEQSLVSDGCILTQSTVRHSVLGLRSILAPGSSLHRTVMMGSDYYESEESVAYHRAKGEPRIGIGENTRIENAIIDKNARVGDNCIISPSGKDKDVDHALYYIRDGIVIVPKNGLVPHGTRI
jgi:glucose-1-phosphate adenylyltransferase